jgi:hypothetical protein
MYKASRLRAISFPLIRAVTPSLIVAGMPHATLKTRLRLPGVRPVVDVSKFVAHRGSKYGPAGNSPLQMGCAVFLKTGSHDAVRRCLAGEAQKFRARSLAEALFSDEDESLRPLTQIHPLDKFVPWDRSAPGHLVTDDPNYGPDLQGRIDVETERIVRLMDSLASVGYRPEHFHKGFVRGYFLLRDDDHRFYVKGGRHRVAAMAALGFGGVRVRLSSHTAPFVDVADVERWPHVRSGFVSRDLALRVMHSFFA